MRYILYILYLSIFAVLPLCLGCPLSTKPEVPVSVKLDDTLSLESVVSRTLESNLKGRSLSIETHGAWQILHAVLAYGTEFPVQTPSGPVATVPYLLEGGKMNGFEPLPGDPLGDPPRIGLRMELQPIEKIGQGHRDYWLAILAQCGLPLETQVKTPQRTYTFEDWLRQAEHDVPRNLELEFSWTLMAQSLYRSTDYRWTARDGQEYTTADLLQSELAQSVPGSACGGMHRLTGIAMVLDKRRSESKPITGVWKEAELRLAEFVEAARLTQNPDGSYSNAYLHRPGWTRDLGESLATTGHVLEFLAFAATDEQLSEPWVERTVRRICQMLDQNLEVDLECGALYHALHALVEYRDRVSRIKLAAADPPGHSLALALPDLRRR
jgi:hypothetical protein